MVHYFIPEDNETEKELNTFAIKLPKNKITLKDIKKSFPIKGEYIFRFKQKYLKKEVFVDVLDENLRVPLCNNQIIFKANRTRWGHPRKKSSTKNDFVGGFSNENFDLHL